MAAPMDTLSKLLDEDEDENGPPVSGAAVDAYTERLKGVLGDGGAAAAASATYGVRAGNGSLKPIPSPPPTQAPTNSSVASATGSGNATQAAGPLQITQAQWAKLTQQQQNAYLQRMSMQRHQYQQQQQQQQQQQHQVQPQQQAAAAQAPRRPTNINQGISFGALMPLLQPHLPPEQASRLSALYQRFKQNEITREDFVRGARVIVGDQVLVQTIRQMHLKQQHQGGSQATNSQQQAGSQQSGGSTQPTCSQQSGSSSQPATPSGPSTQLSPSKPVPDPAASSKSTLGASEQPSVPSPIVQAQSLQQQQQQQQQQPQQQLEQHQQIPQSLKTTEHTQQVGDGTSQAVAQQVASPILQQVKHEVDKALGSAVQAVRPLQMPAMTPFSNFAARPPTLPTPHTVGGQVNPGLPSQILQVPRVATPTQFAGQQQIVQAAQQKPLTKYAKQKLRKEQKKQEEEERIRKLQEDDRLRRQQQLSGNPAVSGHPPASQSAQPISMPSLSGPQPHPKLLEAKQQGAQAIPAVKQEPQLDQNAGGAQRVAVQANAQGQDGQSGQVAQQHMQAASPQVAVPTTLNTTPTLGPASGSLPVASGVTGVPVSTQLLQPSQPSMQVPSASGGAIPQNMGSKTPQKKPVVAVGQKKPGESIPAAAQPASKKQKTQGEADQSIDQLNDVTAVSGVNLREEEEQLLVGPKEESRTTEAMRKLVQEEEERLFLERRPLRAKAQAIATSGGLKSLSEDVERCLSMSAEERLRSMLYKLIKYSKQRCDVEKDKHPILVTSDPRRQVLLIKKKEKEAMEKRQAEENERLRKLNEKKDKGADGDNDDLRQKAQKAQQEEDDKMRAKAANVAARAAVGATDMLSKWTMMAAQGLAKRQGGDTANDAGRAGTTEEAAGGRDQDRRQENGEQVKASGPGRPDADGDGPSGSTLAGRPPGPGPGAGRGGGLRRTGTGQAGRQPRTITLKDVIALLEREPRMSKSPLLYRLYERERKLEVSRRM